MSQLESIVTWAETDDRISIPHASTPTNGHANGHPISLSPTNSMSKESGLATDQNTTPPVENQPAQASAESAKKVVEEAVVDAEMSEPVENVAPVAPVETAETTEPIVPATSPAVVEDLVDMK